MEQQEKEKLIILLRTLLNNNDIEIIKCVIESIIEDLEQNTFKDNK